MGKYRKSKNNNDKKTDRDEILDKLRYAEEMICKSDKCLKRASEVLKELGVEICGGNHRTIDGRPELHIYSGLFKLVDILGATVEYKDVESNDYVKYKEAILDTSGVRFFQLSDETKGESRFR